MAKNNKDNKENKNWYHKENLGVTIGYLRKQSYDKWATNKEDIIQIGSKDKQDWQRLIVQKELSENAQKESKN